MMNDREKSPLEQFLAAVSQAELKEIERQTGGFEAEKRALNIRLTEPKRGKLRPDFFPDYLRVVK